MKLISIVIFSVSLIWSPFIFGQKLGPYNIQSTKVLAQSQGYQYTEGDYAKGVRFVEFILNTRITEAEKNAGLREALQTFQQSPQQTLQEVSTVDQQMQQVYQLQNPVQIALFRSAILSQLTIVFNQTQETFVLKELVLKYNPVLAYDPQNMLAFTQKDFDGFVDMLRFQSQLYGQEFYLDANTRGQYQQQLVQSFLQGNLEMRQTLCLMEILNEYMQASYQQMSADQRQQLQYTMYQQYDPNPANSVPDYTDPKNLPWPPGVDTKEEKQAYLAKRKREIASQNIGYQAMSNMMLEQHATMMNVIENLGGGDTYWEIKYDNY